MLARCVTLQSASGLWADFGMNKHTYMDNTETWCEDMGWRQTAQDRVNFHTQSDTLRLTLWRLTTYISDVPHS